VDELARVGDPHRPGDPLVVAAGPVAGDANGRGVHHLGLVLLQHEVDAVGGRVALAAGADGQDPQGPPARGDLHAVGPDVDHADAALADAEADGAVGHAPDPLAGVGPSEAGPQGDLGPARPVGLGAVVDLVVGEPVPGPGDRLGRADLEAPFDRGPVGHRRAEPDADGQADPDRLAVEGHDRGPQLGPGPEGGEAALAAGRGAGVVGRLGHHPVAGRRGQGAGADPAAAVGGQLPVKAPAGPGDLHRPQPTLLGHHPRLGVKGDPGRPVLWGHGQAHRRRLPRAAVPLGPSGAAGRAAPVARSPAGDHEQAARDQRHDQHGGHDQPRSCGNAPTSHRPPSVPGAPGRDLNGRPALVGFAGFGRAWGVGALGTGSRSQER
jgi:hypothetical protein